MPARSPTVARAGAPAADGTPGDLGRRLVLLDTNALFLPFRARLPLEAEIARTDPGARIVVPQAALQELEGLARAGVRHAEAALRWARTLAHVPGTGRGDEAILSLARGLGASVVTGDQELIGRLRAQGNAVLRPRGARHLERLPPLRPADRKERSPTVKSRSPLEPGRGSRRVR